MLRFFRKIRQNLLEDGKTSAYLKYAVGEVLLVVIGILVALQVNNWNEFRKDRNTEKQIVKTIYEELEQNSEYSRSVLSQIEQRLSSTITLMEYTSNANVSITAKTFDSLMIQAFILPQYTPVKADLDRLFGSDQIDLIQSPKLQELLSDYKNSMDLTNLFYVYAEDDFKLTILPYFVKNYPLRSLMIEYGLPVPHTRHERNYEDLLLSREFENILSVIYADSGGQLQSIQENLRLMEELKNLIEKDFPSMASNET